MTVFHRGLHGPRRPEAEELLGDRTSDLSALVGREWDAVIDTCGFEPERRRRRRGALADRVGHYGFVSSGSAYRGLADAPVDEDSPSSRATSEEYGAAQGGVRARRRGRDARPRAGSRARA